MHTIPIYYVIVMLPGQEEIKSEIQSIINKPGTTKVRANRGLEKFSAKNENSGG